MTQPSREELLACPFCGSPATLKRFVPGDAPCQITHIQCPNDEGCKVCVDVQHVNEAIAIAAWNTRIAVAQTAMTVGRDEATAAFDRAYWISWHAHSGTEPTIARQAGIDAILVLYAAPPASSGEVRDGPDDDWEERGAAAELREATIEECAKELETSYPDHVWLNAACAAIRALKSSPSVKD